MDEKDVIGRRFSDGTSADWEIQRMSMELSNQPNGFDQLGKGPLVIVRFDITLIFSISIKGIV